MSDLEKKIVIVTGGNGGIGSALVYAFLKNKFVVYALDKEFSKKTLRKNENLTDIKINITNFNKIKKIFKQIAHKEGKIDILINCAGITMVPNKKKLLKYWNKTIDTNLTSAFMLSMLALPYLKRSTNASIINITSLTGKIAMSNNPAYNASKAGLANLGFSLAMDFKKYKIRVNNICPGYIKTNMTKKSYNNKKMFEKRVNRMMISDYGEPNDIAQAALFLTSNKSKYINASEIVVDGGLLKKGI